MPTSAQFGALLASVPTISLDRRLVRNVPFLHLSAPPDFLYTSGKPGRYNPAGARCVYFAEDEETLRLEYRANLATLQDEFQPLATYWAEVRLRHVIDLVDPPTVAHLGLTAVDLLVPWRGATALTVIQTLGQAVEANPNGVTAVRFASAAAGKAGKKGCSVVIFLGCVKAPDSVRIIGPSGKTLQQCP